MKYPLVENPFDKNDLAALTEVIKSEQFTMGPQVARFEKAFAEKFHSPYAVMVNSGSSANLIGMSAFLYKKNPLKPGDEVLVPAVGWSTTWAPLHQLGFKLRVVDVNPETLNVDVDAYEKAITPQTRAVVSVSILGNPLDFPRLRSLCDKNNFYLIEDNCESIGASCGEKALGTFGDVGTFSFFYSHHMSTMEGGMIVTADPEIYELALKLRAHGWERALPGNTESPLSKELYCFTVPGYNVRPLEFSGALGLSQLKSLDEKIKARRENAKKFVMMMNQFQDLRIQKERHGPSSWYAFTLVLKEGGEHRRNQLIRHLAEQGIESRMITGGCLTRHPMARHFHLSEASDLRHALEVHSSGLFVANFSSPMEDKLSLLSQSLTSFGLS